MSQVSQVSQRSAWKCEVEKDTIQSRIVLVNYQRGATIREAHEAQVGISKAGSPGNEPERTGEPLVDAHVRHEQSADRELFRARVERGDRHVRRVAHVRKKS